MDRHGADELSKHEPGVAYPLSDQPKSQVCHVLHRSEHKWNVDCDVADLEPRERRTF